MNITKTRAPLTIGPDIDDYANVVSSDIGSSVDSHSLSTGRLGADSDSRGTGPQTATTSPQETMNPPAALTPTSTREAVRCREKRQRRKEREQLLCEEVELLTLYKAMVDNGPDMFSLHRVNIEAPFSFVGDTFFEQMQLPPEHILGRPLATIVDARDTHDLRSALFQVLGQKHTDGGRGASSSGTLVHIRVISCGRSCQASMSIRIGSQGLVVVTRLY